MGDSPDVSDRTPKPSTQSAAVPSTEDPIAYRIAVGMVGAALVAFLIGAAVIAAGGKPVPTQYWTAGSAIAGALLGILAPTPQRSSKPQAAAPAAGSLRQTLSSLWSWLGKAFDEFSKNRAVFILMAVFGVSAAFAIAHGSAELESVAGAAGGALVGLLAPPPGKQSRAGE